MRSTSLIINGRTIENQTLTSKGKSLKEERKGTNTGNMVRVISHHNPQIIVDIKGKTQTPILNSKSQKEGKKKTNIGKRLRVISNHTPRMIVDIKRKKNRKRRRNNRRNMGNKNKRGKRYTSI